MILPTKGVGPSTSLIAVGADILASLDERMTISSTWAQTGRRRDAAGSSDLGFDWFILALDLLYALGAVDFIDGFLHKGPLP
jgi:hypothetical protein